MKRFLKNILKFIPLAVIAYILLLYIWAKWSPSFFEYNLIYSLGSPGYTYTRLQEVKKKNNIDILFIGSSHTYRGFDIRQYESLGYKTFNLGTNMQTPIQTKLLLERYLDQLNPKLIIYEVFPATFENSGMEPGIDIISNDKIDFLSFKMTIALNHMKVYNTWLYAFLLESLNKNEGFNETHITGYDTYINGGYVERSLDYHRKETLPHKKKKWEPKKIQMEKFDETLKQINDKELNLILVYAPVPKAFFTAYRNGSSFDSIMESKAHYINVNSLIELNDSLDFYDSNHLNQNGVKKFNELLIDELKLNTRIEVY